MSITLIASYPVNSGASNLNTLTSASFSPSNGELLVVKIAAEDASTTIGTTSGGGQIFTQRLNLTSASQCPIVLMTSIVSGSPGAMTISVTFGSTGGWHNMIIERWSGAQLAATPAVTATFSGGTTPSTTITTTAANSVVTWFNADWNGIPPGTPGYLSSATQNDLFDQSATNAYVNYSAYQTAATAGSQTFGMTAPTGQKPSMGAIELQAIVNSVNFSWLKF